MTGQLRRKMNAIRIARHLRPHRTRSMTKAKKTKPAHKSNKKKKVAPTNRATTRAALQKTPTRGKTVPAKLTEKNMTPKALRTPKTPKMTSAGVAKKPRSSTKSGGRRTTPKKPKNTTSYIMNQRKYGAQPPTPRPLSGMKSPRLETLATATMKPPASGLDMFGSMLGALSPAALERVEVEGEESTSEVIKLCSIITEQAKTIQRLESEVNHLRAQLQARAVAPVPTLRRVPSTTSELASRIAGLFKR